MLTAAQFDRHMPINRGMTYEQMLDAVETQPVHVIEATLDDDTSGLYCEAVQTIIIDEHMTDVQKRCSLTHELFHWLHADDSHAEYGKSHAEWRVRRETAMFLINPADYVQAEREYVDFLPAAKAGGFRPAHQGLGEVRRQASHGSSTRDSPRLVRLTSAGHRPCPIDDGHPG